VNIGDRHLLSHQTIHARFYEIELKEDKKMNDEKLIAVSPAQFQKYAVPKPIERYVESK
jgi:hypothetical protein